MNSALPVVLCVGSDKIMGDSIGPTVGDLLINFYNLKCFVYGTTGNSVNGKNLNEYLAFIKAVHPENPIIAIDACMSNQEDVGKIKIIKGGVNPKCAITKCRNPVGDIGILGVIDKIRKDALGALLTASNDDMLKISNKIAFVLYSALLY